VSCGVEGGSSIVPARCLGTAEDNAGTIGKSEAKNSSIRSTLGETIAYYKMSIFWTYYCTGNSRNFRENIQEHWKMLAGQESFRTLRKLVGNAQRSRSTEVSLTYTMHVAKGPFPREQCSQGIDTISPTMKLMAA